MSIEDGPGSVQLGQGKFKSSGALKLTEKADGSYNLCRTDENLLNVAYKKSVENNSETGAGKAMTHKLWVWAFWFATLGLYLFLSGPNTLGEDSTKARMNVTNETTTLVGGVNVTTETTHIDAEIVPVLAYPQNLIGLALVLAALVFALLGGFFVEQGPGFGFFGCRICNVNGCNYFYFLFNDLICGLGGLCCAGFIAEEDLV